ncbi:NAD(P)/FAD-dependent oxidoreductase [Pseudomonas neustonica]|uniref:FAD-dependent oxidoreductase n=1 Tax=Pseudomonas neustonica TaxID=2487346 RepID=A0ABX9XQ91_9PSED|nr:MULTISPECIES: FAD-dependent oxidoreductase [Pseudomonas]MAB25676.1 FAD-dependent oxidoreductase [Pseudomonadales bacterium]MBA6419727.1 FAD-dependent oxidoreductase [Pseudomonas sp. 5Ae-yellow]ROZ87196.1 FAD-dependent oxidoreductase [Pseudomonas sp. SSM44]ROZ88187.1 FAD-dependent oxidoreductase [Pseudomonas neustonica]|tara:strand:+ start:891 stop:2069 length:1179 start_codon:yes stop_codon:yes gene_type:complete
MSTTLETDICILGGGIAGLWLNARLRQLGYSTLLVERGALGGGQSVKSQGIIHGGTKYALNGKLSSAAEAIAGMPERWRASLQGTGELDLQGVRVLSEHHYLWSPGSLISNLAGFFASKALRGRVEQVKGKQLPKVFSNAAFKGKVYQLAELVIDVPTAIQRLADLAGDSLIADSAPHLQRASDGSIEGVRLQHQTIKAQRYVLSAGEGTEGLLNDWQHPEPVMQRRPLQMVLVKGPDLPPLYAHCLGSSPKPRMTVTTHPCADGQWCWYLGGELAEQGAGQTPDDLINKAKRELRELLPWVSLEGTRWTTLPVNRAEPAQSGLVRPDTAFVQPVANALVSWPTKLALAPNLADQVIAQLAAQQIKPEKPAAVTSELPKPKVSAPVWDICFP